MDARIAEMTRLWTLATPLVSGFILSLVRNYQDRDDILQDTAVAVLNSFEKYDKSKPFAGWVIGIAKNQILLHFRKTNKNTILLEPSLAESLQQAFSDSSSANNNLDHLAECFKALDPKSKELCKMRYELDMKPASIAEKIEMKANSVAKTLQRIRDELRDCIQRKNKAEFRL